MDLNISNLDFIKLMGKLIAHKYQQYRLATKEYEIVNTKCGQVKGSRRKNLHKEYGNYSAFEGIPYAKKPIGELRFRAPLPAEPWSKVLDCTNCKSKPMQYDYISNRIEGSEDCLYINVYAKSLKINNPMPVMVWIYGGGFQIGESSRDLYAPDYFMQRDVILVTFNYRLGIFGFLSLEDPDLKIPGNAGLKDQILALKWVKDNISNFNGDPNNITVFGESAGAASLHLLMLSPQAKGLFHKAILQSGSALCHWAVHERNDNCFKLARHIGFKGQDNAKDVYKFFMQQPASALTIKDNNLMTKQDIMSHLIVIFRPVIEPYIMPDCILDRPIKQMLATAWSNEIPLIIGANSSEGLFYYNTVQMYPFLIDELTDLVSLLPDDVRSCHENTQLKEMASRIRDTYFGGQPNSKDHFFQYLDLIAHRSFWHGVYRAIRARLAYAASSETYCYQFDFDSPFLNHFRILKCGHSVRGVSHADDLPYLFYCVMSPKLCTNSKEFKCIQRMVALWQNFALTSNPNCDESKPVVWHPVTDAVKCLNISDDLEFKELPMSEALKLWDGFYAKNDYI